MEKNIEKKKKSFWGIFGNVVFYLVLIAMLAVCVTMVKAKIDGKQPSILGHKFFVVLTGSMSPTIEVGDLVITKEVTPEEIKANDIITFGSENSKTITTHRVKDVLNENGQIKFVTQGDANNTQDPSPVNSEVVIGKVVNYIPKVGTTMQFMQKNLIYIIAGVIGIAVLISVLVVVSKSFDKAEAKKLKEKEIQDKSKEKVEK